MKQAKHISAIAGLRLIVSLVLAMAAIAAITTTAQADPPTRVSVTGTADIHVWLDEPRDIYPGYDDVVISVQATRGCYASVFLVDTFGYIHVIHPFSPYANAWMVGGVTYSFSGRALGIERLGSRGIVHVFAIGGPHPFDFSPYGEAIFAGGYGFRVIGDPYVACRELYVSLLPVAYRWDRAGIGFARFYVREWSRYPTYLCYGYHGGTTHVRVGGRCHSCYPAYETYRIHVNDPRVAMRNAPRYKDTHRDSYARTKIHRAAGVEERSVRAKTAVRRSTNNIKIVSAKRTDRSVTVKKARAAKQTNRAQAMKSKTSTSQTSRSTVKTRDRAATQKVKYQKGKVSR